ncbi:DUF952 domain-containing protein [Sphingomonas cavernae]|uniref:DUF952 domain-containing protein n=1 Tax=Sphingomonas cavernae TaxID=2320861 RepID=A0A418WMX8_9SPHN|nr:DUF952 domain-containing protein [Sphingomonas cavernae]RJF91359.1 DUF952 domain-containing protein [Sphingomonas cavernae]
MSAVAYKILTAEQWSELDTTGRFEGAPVDLADGYIHMSTAEQVRETADKHFAGQEQLVLAIVDLVALGDGVKWEPSRGEQLFPHFYGVLPRAAVIDAAPLQLDADGKHVFPAL